MRHARSSATLIEDGAGWKVVVHWQQSRFFQGIDHDECATHQEFLITGIFGYESSKTRHQSSSFISSWRFAIRGSTSGISGSSNTTSLPRLRAILIVIH